MGMQQMQHNQIGVPCLKKKMEAQVDALALANSRNEGRPAILLLEYRYDLDSPLIAVNRFFHRWLENEITLNKERKRRRQKKRPSFAQKRKREEGNQSRNDGKEAE